MVGDQPVKDFHHLDDVHLVAVGRLARLLPNQPGAVGKKSGAVPTTLGWRLGRAGALTAHGPCGRDPRGGQDVL